MTTRLDIVVDESLPRQCINDRDYVPPAIAAQLQKRPYYRENALLVDHFFICRLGDRKGSGMPFDPLYFGHWWNFRDDGEEAKAGEEPKLNIVDDEVVQRDHNGIRRYLEEKMPDHLVEPGKGLVICRGNTDARTVEEIARSLGYQTRILEKTPK